MNPFEKCPVCGGGLENKRVEKILQGGGNTVSIKVFAQVCRRCGERLYPEGVIRSFEDIRAKLQQKECSRFRTLGQSFTVSGDWPNEAIRPAA